MEKEYTIAIDLGGTIIKLGLLKSGELLAREEIKAMSSGGLKLQLPRIENAIDQLLEESEVMANQISGMGLSFAGLVASDRNRIISTNKKYDDGPQIDLVAWAKETWDWPLFAMNDARMALLGEWKHGAGQGCDHIVMVTIGTGIGTAVLQHGKLLLGKHFQAGNLGGHFTVNHKGTTCTCGNIGCVEAEALTWRLPSLIKEHPQFNHSSLRDLETLDFEALFYHAQNNDLVANEVMEHCLSAWAGGIITMIHAYDPEMVILSGGIMKSADLILPILQEKVHRHAWTPWGKVKLVIAQHPDSAALYGVDCLVKKRHPERMNLTYKNSTMWKAFLFVVLPFIIAACNTSENYRKEIDLNGIWEIAKTGNQDSIPQFFSAGIAVPGLVDMATPPVDQQDTLYENALYWYKRTIVLENTNSDIIQLKINKAKYHTRVFVNGSFVGENPFNFTPGLFDLKEFLKPGENELIISVGCKNNLPDSVTNGGDFEKTKYIPGIYDDVKLILSGSPFISNIQTVPDINNQQLRIVAELITENLQTAELSYTIRESVSRKIVARGKTLASQVIEMNLLKADFIVKMEGCTFWTPENPFLYKVEISTKADNTFTKFGMRSFETSPEKGVFLLNGKPYFLRGTNVCIFRFFEDPDRKGLPWNDEWVAKLHSRFKDMHWNSIRYCIGFPPERWYEIADSLGFLIQDEFPVWTGGKGGFERLLPGVTPSGLAQEYRQWMRERWNHPCVVIWDAQNESVTEITGKAIQMVRHLDLSNRPWENGWAAPVSEYDAIESHPYMLTKYFKEPVGYEGYMKELLSKPRIPDNGPNEWSPSPDGNKYKNPVIINEYGWIWLNRNGSTTTLTDFIYPKVFPGIDSPEHRLEAYAKTLAIKTEYWRAHQHAAGVLHFCGLGYSRPEPPRGQTSDNFTDIQNLVFEPSFYKYVKPAFAPTGIMIDFWEKSILPNQQITVPVHIVNDTQQKLESAMSLTLYRDTEMIDQKSVDFILDGASKTVLETTFQIPDISGTLKLLASIVYKDEIISSIREFETGQALHTE